MAAFSLQVDDIYLVLEKEKLLGCQIVYITRNRPTKTHKIGLDITTIQKLIDVSDEIKEIIDK